MLRTYEHHKSKKDGFLLWSTHMTKTTDGATRPNVMVARTYAVGATWRIRLNVLLLQWTAGVFCILILLNVLNIQWSNI